LIGSSLWLQTLFNQVWGEGNLEKQYPCYDGNGENDLLQALMWSALLYRLLGSGNIALPPLDLVIERAERIIFGLAVNHQA